MSSAFLQHCDTCLQVHKADLAGMPRASEDVGGLRRFLDISVPRNIASDLNDLDTDARVFNVDDLKEVCLEMSLHVGLESRQHSQFPIMRGSVHAECVVKGGSLSGIIVPVALLAMQGNFGICIHILRIIVAPTRSCQT